VSFLLILEKFNGTGLHATLVTIAFGKTTESDRHCRRSIYMYITNRAIRCLVTCLHLTRTE